MKAVRIHGYGGPDVLVYEEVEKPRPKPDQVVVEVKAAAVNQFDVTIREGRFVTPIAPPRIIGSDGAGVVVEIGAEVTSVAAGDEVLFTGIGIGTQGSYAEYATIAAVQAVPKPPSLSFPEAAAMGLVFPTALYALRRADAREDEIVLVQGAAGGVGSAAVQLARALGLRVLGSVLERESVEGVLALGAEAVVDLSTEEPRERVRALTDDRGVDLVLEVATSDNIAVDLDLIVKGGRIVCIGQGRSSEAAIPYGAASSRDASLLYMSSSNAGRAGMARMLREVADLVEDGRVHPVLGATLPLAEARKAHELLAARHFGKIVLTP